MTTKLGDFFTDQTRKRRLLALDGGGVRGMFTIGVLQELEAQLRHRYRDRDYKLCQYFDLIAGTSTGSIIAAGLALGMTTAEISAYYKELCPKIFKSPAPSVWAAMMSAKHASGPLTKALGKAFGVNTLASPKLETGLAINCMRLDRGSAWILCNNPKWKYYGDATDLDGDSESAANKRYRLRDLVQASAAAPFYFRGVQLTVATDESGTPAVWRNRPRPRVRQRVHRHHRAGPERRGAARPGAIAAERDREHPVRRLLERSELGLLGV